MLMLVAGPATACSVTLTLTLPLDPVTVTDFATVGSVYVVLACPFEPVIAGLGEAVPLLPVMATGVPKLPPAPPSLKATLTPATGFPLLDARTVSAVGRTVPVPPV